MEFRKTPKGYIIRLFKGEKILQQLTQFCKEQQVHSGIFYGIGAVEEAELAFYHLATKTYTSKPLAKALEIVSLTGNVALVDNAPLLHVHAVFADVNLQCYGGHLEEGKVGPTCEIYLIDFETTIERVYDETIGLKLLSCAPNARRER
jgi:hypothetical protein